jgi:4-diphosphocytidyl-2-C-methyl-D-erythritol kinase
MIEDFPIWFAPAKLNLFLHITGKRADGYHNLQTVFQLLDYGDQLQFVPRNDNQFKALYSITGITPGNDLILKAATTLYRYGLDNKLINEKKNYGLDIYLHKNLPLGGGLGGGSSDAATTLNALNQMWNFNLDKYTLAQLGLALGADIPVFVHGFSCWAEGVGEQITAYAIPPSYYVVLIPNIHISTAELFTDKKLKRDCKAIDYYDYQQTENVFESIVRKKYPAIEKTFKWLAAYAPPRLTGTGACVFVSIATEEQCKNIIEQLPDDLLGFYAKGI